MIIAISQRNDKNSYGDYFDNLESNYISFFEGLGASVIPISNSSKDIPKYFDKIPISAVILSGGNDINPILYGGKLKEGMTISNQRDQTEKNLLEISIRRGIPVLGICRGMHFINVYFKGRLINIEEKFSQKINHIRKDHKVEIEGENAIKILGKEIETNSYHKYGITKEELSNELKSFAKSNEIIEGLFHSNLPIAGIQWHPERDGPDKEINKKLIMSFLNGEFFWEKR